MSVLVTFELTLQEDKTLSEVKESFNYLMCCMNKHSNCVILPDPKRERGQPFQAQIS